MEARSSGQKEYESAVALMDKKKATDKDIADAIALLNSAFELKYVSAIRLAMRIILKNNGFKPNMFPDDKQGNNLFKQLTTNQKASKFISELKFDPTVQTMAAMQIADTKIAKTLLKDAATRPSPCFYAQYLYAMTYADECTDNQIWRFVKAAALEGLPVAQLMCALMIVLGSTKGPEVLSSLSADLMLNKNVHAMQVYTILQQLKPLSVFSMSLTERKKTFGFDEALATLENPPKPFAELAKPLKQMCLDGAKLKISATHVLNSINLLEVDPARAVEAFNMIRCAAYEGNTQALYMLSFLILRAANNFSKENPVVLTINDEKETYQQETTRRDKAVLTLLDNVKVREILQTEFGEKRNIKLAADFLDCVTKKTHTPRTELDIQSFAAKLEMADVLAEGKEEREQKDYSPLLIESSFAKMNGALFLLAKSKLTVAEKNHANNLVDNFILHADQMHRYVMLLNLTGGDIPPDMMRAYQIVKTFERSSTTSARYIYALIAKKGFDIPMSEDLRRYDTDAQYQLDREIVDAILRDPKVKNQIKIDTVQNAISRYTPQVDESDIPGQKEYKSALELIGKVVAKDSINLSQKHLQQKEVYSLLEKAVAKNHAKAKSQLAVQICITNKQDIVRAYKLIIEADAANDEMARLILNRMKSCKEQKATKEFGDGAIYLVATSLLANTKVQWLFNKYLQEQVETLQALAVTPVLSNKEEKKEAPVKDKQPIPKFKSQFFATLGSKRRVELDKILPVDPLFLIKVVHALVYKKMSVSDVAIADIKAQAATLEKCERNAEFWRLLHEGLMYGKGKEFIHQLREKGFAKYVLGECKDADLDYFEFRASCFDRSLALGGRPLFLDHEKYNPTKQVYPNALYALLIEKELEQDKPITAVAVKAVMEKFKFPINVVSEMLLFRVKEEREKKKKFMGQSQALSSLSL